MTVDKTPSLIFQISGLPWDFLFCFASAASLCVTKSTVTEAGRALAPRADEIIPRRPRGQRTLPRDER